MEIIWDEPKRRQNLRKHGFDFEEVGEFDWIAAMIAPARSGAHGNRRYRAIGILRDELVTVVFSPLGSEAISIISLRPASRSERRLYARGQETLPH